MRKTYILEYKRWAKRILENPNGKSMFAVNAAKAAFHNVVVDGSGRVQEPDVLLVDDDLNRLDEAINKLHPDMRVVIVAHYVWIDPVKVKIDKLKISRTVYLTILSPHVATMWGRK